MYEDRILAFVDVLGFSKQIGKTLNEDETENILEIEKINTLLNNLQWEKHFCEQYNDYQFLKNRIAHQFSDTIIISRSITEKEEFVRILSDVHFLYVLSLQENFLLRGAIVCGKIYDIENIVFGPALVKAYEIEKNKAIFPRVILDESYLDLAKNAIMEYNFEPYISSDFDGMQYVNYFEEHRNKSFEIKQDHFYKIKNTILEMDISIDSVKPKYLWIKEKYNEKITFFKDEYEGAGIEIL